MLLRGTLGGVAVLFGLSVWSWARAADHHDADPVRPAVAVVDAGGRPGGTYDDAAHRFRAGQARHWRQVMIGGR